MNYQQQQPEGKGAGCLAVIISTVIVYKVALPFSHVIVTIMDHENIQTGRTIIELGSVLLLWMGLSWLVQFILDEYIALPFMQRKRANDARRYILLIDSGKQTSSGKKWLYALLLFGGLWLFWK